MPGLKCRIGRSWLLCQRVDRHREVIGLKKDARPRQSLNTQIFFKFTCRHLSNLFYLRLARPAAASAEVREVSSIAAISSSLLRGGLQGILKALTGRGSILRRVITNAFLERPEKAASARIAAGARYLVDGERVCF